MKFQKKIFLFTILFCSLMFSVHGTSVNFYEVAENFYQQGNYFQALVNYYDEINLNPENVDAKNQYEKISSMFKNGKPSFDELDVFEIHDEWFNVLRSFENYWTKNCPFEFYISSLRLSTVDFNSRTVNYNSDVRIQHTPKYQEIYSIIKTGFDKAYKTEWTGVNSNWPETSVYKKAKSSFQNGVALKKLDLDIKVASLENNSGVTNYFADIKIVDNNGNIIIAENSVELKSVLNFKNVDSKKMDAIDRNSYRIIVSNVQLKYGFSDENLYLNIAPENVVISCAEFDVDDEIDLFEPQFESENEDLFFDEEEDVFISDIVMDGEELDEIFAYKPYSEIQQELLEVEISNEKQVETSLEDLFSSPTIDMQKYPGVNFNMVKISGGSFDYGRNEDNPGKRVSVEDFEIGQTEVTQILFMAVMEQAPSSKKGKFFPVERVNWFDTIYFCNQLSLNMGYTPCYSVNGKKDPKKWGYVPGESQTIKGVVKCDFIANGFRLPTEIEWEYAAREGELNSSYKYSGSDILDDVAWSEFNSGAESHEVGTKKSNALGIYDLSGNVWEWCWDAYENSMTHSITGRDTSEFVNSARVLKGGGYDYESYCSVSFREQSDPFFRCDFYGFRLCRTIK